MVVKIIRSASWILPESVGGGTQMAINFRSYISTFSPSGTCITLLHNYDLQLFWPDQWSAEQSSSPWWKSKSLFSLFATTLLRQAGLVIQEQSAVLERCKGSRWDTPPVPQFRLKMLKSSETLLQENCQTKHKLQINFLTSSAQAVGYSSLNQNTVVLGDGIDTLDGEG